MKEKCGLPRDRNPLLKIDSFPFNVYAKTFPSQEINVFLMAKTPAKRETLQQNKLATA